MRSIVQYLEKRRYSMVLRRIRGRLLDIGCGENRLVREYGNGVGVDVYPWNGVDQVIEDPAKLPFDDGSFDTISFIACLNHIPNREKALREARRCLSPGGTLLATMIGPAISILWHRLIRSWDEDQTERGMKPGEVWGISRSRMKQLFEQAGFKVVGMKRFICGLNTLYICQPNAVQDEVSRSATQQPVLRNA